MDENYRTMPTTWETGATGGRAAPTPARGNHAREGVSSHRFRQAIDTYVTFLRFLNFDSL